MASPKGTSWSPNALISLSPAKKATAPPVLGRVAAISAMAFPAMAALFTASASSPLMLAANRIMDPPKPTSWFPNSPMSFSPVKNPAMPPRFGRVAAISASVLPAIAAVLTKLPSRPAMLLENFIIASPKGTSSPAKADREDPPVSQEVNPSSRSAAVISKIASVSAFTPSSMAASMPRAPSINGCTLVMNAARSAPICGNDPDIPLINPPTIPPINPPMAFPMVCSSLPPSPISQSRPGICARPPMAARTTASSAITTPRPSTPTIAEGISPANAPRAAIMPLRSPIPATPFRRASVSMLPKADTIPEKKDISKLTTDWISVGRLRAKPSMTSIRNCMMESTICGV